MKTYLQTIKRLQTTLLGISIIILIFLPELMAFYPTLFTQAAINGLYDVSHISLFLVMIVRPLADIITKTSWIRPLVILRKGMGVLSASVAVSFLLAKIIVDPAGYIAGFGTLAYWSFNNFAIFAHLADISAILLLITSNSLSKRLLGSTWKTIQRLSYVYFYGSAIYVLFVYGTMYMLYSMIIVTTLTLIAFFMNKSRRNTLANAKPQTI